MIQDQELARLYDEVVLKTQAPILDKKRINLLLFWSK